MRCPDGTETGQNPVTVLAAYNDAAKTSTMLGHAGNPDVLFNHYRSVLVPRAGVEYFSLTPEKVDKELAAELRGKIAAARGKPAEAKTVKAA